MTKFNRRHGDNNFHTRDYYVVVVLGKNNPSNPPPISSKATETTGMAQSTSTKYPNTRLPIMAPSRPAVEVNANPLPRNFVGKSSTPKQSIAMNPDVDTRLKRMETPRLAPLLFTRYTKNTEAPETAKLANKMSFFGTLSMINDVTKYAGIAAM